MSENWRRFLGAGREELDRLKRGPSLRVLEERADLEKEETTWTSSAGKIKALAASPGKVPDHKDEFESFSALVTDLANRIRKTFAEMRDLAASSRGKFKDPAFGQEFHRRMTEHIDHSEADINCFLDYLRIKSPARQTNIIHVILEEALEKHKKKLMDKGIRIFKKQFEKGLPDANVHLEELRFILNWALEYAILSAAPNQSIALLTRSLEAQEGREAIRSEQKNGTKCVEIAIASGNYEDLTIHAGVPSDIRGAHNGGRRSWILPLVDEIVQKNRGSMKLSEGRLKMVSLMLPIEGGRVCDERALVEGVIEN